MTSSPTPSRRAVLRAVGGAAAGAASYAASGAALGAAGRRPQRVIVFTRTHGYRHASIPNAIATLKELGRGHGIRVVASEDPAIFTRARLRECTAIVFACTQGNVLTTPARRAIKEFVTSGGGWMGVHSAADSEYVWPFYTRLLSGGRFLCHPLINQSGTIVRESATHLSTRHLPRRWTVRSEEFYSFKADVRGRAKVLLSLDESTYRPDPNTSLLPEPPADLSLPTLLSELKLPHVVSGRMGDHPMCWQDTVGRGVSWYTALGHNPELYDDPDFRRHLLGGLLTVSHHGRSHLPV